MPDFVCWFLSAYPEIDSCYSAGDYYGYYDCCHFLDFLLLGSPSRLFCLFTGLYVYRYLLVRGRLHGLPFSFFISVVINFLS